MARKKKQPADASSARAKRSSPKSNQRAKTKRRVRPAARPAAGLPAPPPAEKDFHLRTVLTGAPIVLFALDKEGVFTLAEGKGLEKLGLRSDQLVGRSVFDTFRALPGIEGKFREALDGSLHHSIDRIGDALFESQFSPLRDQQGTLTGVIGVATDVTERKRFEAALRMTEQRYQTLIDSMSEGLLMVDHDDVIQFVNDPYCTMVGYQREELLGRLAMDTLLRPEDRELMESRNTHRMQGVAEQFEIQIRKKSGELIWVQISAAAITDAEGNVVGSIAVQTDITGRKKAEDITERASLDEKRRSSEEWYRDLVENISEIYFVVDKDGKTTYCSPNMEMLTGYTVEEVLGSSFVMLISPQDRRRVLRFYLDRTRDGTLDATIEFRGRKKDGSDEWVEQSTRVIRDSAGQVVEYRNVARNIRERKKVEGQLLLLGHALESTAEMICITDMEDRFTFANRAFLNAYGYELNELVGKGPDTIGSPRNSAGISQTIFHETRKGGWKGELMNRRKDGSEFPVFLSTSLIRNEDGVPVALVGVARDITEEKNALAEFRDMATGLEQRILERTAEIALQKNELSRVNEQLEGVIDQLKEAKGRAEEANRVKSQFLANVTHEVRTPLNSIIGFANVLLKNREQNLNRQEIDYLEKVLANGKHLLNVINQMLDLSKIEAGHANLEITSIFLATLIRETVAELEAQAPEGVEIRTEISSQIAPFRTDYGKLKQVLINLIANALKFTRRGNVTVLMETNPLTSQPVRIDVRDTGIGIPAEKLEAIFEAFYQVDNSPSRKYEGTGLGLTISRALCGVMGYRLEVTSKLGEGSVFSIYLVQQAGKETVGPA